MHAAPILFFENGRIWTGESSSPWADSLVVTQGRLLAVGQRGELGWLRAHADRVVDLDGRLVLPGFNDAHLHAYEGGKSLLEIDLRTVQSLDELKQRVREYAASLPEGEWVTGGNWDHQNWGGHPLPDRRVLDEAAGPRPVLLFRVDWHVAAANSAALQAAHIGRNTPDPPGGEIERDDHGEPTGILKDAAAELVLSKVPEPSDARLQEILTAAMSEAVRYGVTSYQDNVTSRQFRTYQRLAENRELKVRVSCWFPLSELDCLVDVGLRRWLGDPWLQIGTVKIFADGSLGAGTAYFFQDYADRPGYRGLLMMPGNQLHQVIAKVHNAGLQAAVHAIGDAANALVLDIFEELGATRAHRHRIEHAQTVRDVDVARFAEFGVVASVQPVHAVDDLRWAHQKSGNASSSRTASLLSLEAAPRWRSAQIGPLHL
ncbi:MAG: amidohydrolase [Calditrichaeota bacterium]|nr:amidohydrolase [Calditrichota bacterium]